MSILARIDVVDLELKRLRDDKEVLLADAEVLCDLSEAERRDFSESEEQAFESLLSQASSISDQIEALQMRRCDLIDQRSQVLQEWGFIPRH